MIRRLAVAAVLVGAVAVTGGLVAAARDDPPVRGAAVPTADLGVVPTGPAPTPAASASTPAASASTPPSAPVASALTIGSGSRLVLARLGVDAPLSGVALDGRVMQVPRDPHVVGWWRGGAAPGAGHGSVVVVGHVNYAGTPGAFGVLPEVRPGDRVTVRAHGGERSYRVVAVRSYPKTTGIPDAAFATTGSERLVLITCGGSFDPSTGNYVDNVVVYAVPVT